MKKLLGYIPHALTLIAAACAPVLTFAPILIPNTGLASTASTTPPYVATTTLAAVATTTATNAPHPSAVVRGDAPFAVSIPAIEFDNPVVRVGLNEKGEMAVPSGRSDNVGWYKYGVMPGMVGSAVLDAHVYAAFKDLDELRVGDDIYVTNKDGTELHFVVEETATTKLEETSAARLFERADKARLNLITCAGQYDILKGTYDHRLIVYAVLVKD